MPNYFTSDAIKAAIIWMQSQTLPNTVSNIFLGDLLDNMVDFTPDFNNLSNVQKRQLKNAMDSINTGSFQSSPLPGEFAMESLSVRIEQTGYDDQIITAVKDFNKTSWLLGEPVYSIFLNENIPAVPVVGTTYYQISTADNQSVIFGGSLGGLNAGLSLGSFITGFSLQVQAVGLPGEANHVPISVNIENQVTGNFPAMFGIRSEGTLRKSILPGETVSFNIIDVTESASPQFTFPEDVADIDGYYRLESGVTMDIKINGGLFQSIPYAAGTVMPSVKYGWTQEYVNGLSEGDLLSITFRDTI